MKINDNLRSLYDLFVDNGYELYPVGGCVRDYLMKKEPDDIDLATSATPEQMKTMNTKFKIIPTGEKYGTITFVVGDEFFEVTTFRNDYDYVDNRRPSVISYSGDLKDDLKRRDFTINAMAYDIENREIIDPFNGSTDLKNKLIRTVGNPVERFSEDHLRIIRAYRFSYVNDFNIETESKMTIEMMIKKINSVSNERIQAEIVKIFRSTNYKRLEDMNLLFFELIPVLEDCLYCEQNNPYHYTDVYHHSLDAISYLKDYNLSTDKLVVAAIALLFHDVGKPEVKTTKDGIDHFYNHTEKSVEYAKSWLKKYSFSNVLKKKILFLIKYHDQKLFDMNNSDIYHCLKRGGFEMMKLLLVIQKCDISAQNQMIQERIDLIDANTERMLKIYNQYVAVDPLQLNGSILKNWGYHPGELYKDILMTVNNLIVDDMLENDLEVIRAYVEKRYSRKK